MASPWKPIETAPKDGSNILVHDPRFMHYASACDAVALPAFWGGAVYKTVPKWLSAIDHEMEYQPTHWMPMPEAPVRLPLCYSLDWSGWEFFSTDPDDLRIKRQLADGRWARVSHYPEGTYGYGYEIEQSGEHGIGEELSVFYAIARFVEANGGWK